MEYNQQKWDTDEQLRLRHVINDDIKNGMEIQSIQSKIY
jgi:hypothetical protein